MQPKLKLKIKCINKQQNTKHVEQTFIELIWRTKNPRTIVGLHISTNHTVHIVQDSWPISFNFAVTVCTLESISLSLTVTIATVSLQLFYFKSAVLEALEITVLITPQSQALRGQQT